MDFGNLFLALFQLIYLAVSGIAVPPPVRIHTDSAVADCIRQGQAVLQLTKAEGNTILREQYCLPSIDIQ